MGRIAADWSPLNDAERAEVKRHYPLLVNVARAAHGRRGYVELDEMVQDGAFGLVRAVRRFKPELGFKFASYAEPRLRGAMLDGIRRRDWMPRRARESGERRPEQTGMPHDIKAPQPTTDAENLDAFESLIQPLRPYQKAVMRMLYVENLNTVQVGRRIGRSPCRVSQLRWEAINDLRKSMA